MSAGPISPTAEQPRHLAPHLRQTRNSKWIRHCRTAKTLLDRIRISRIQQQSRYPLFSRPPALSASIRRAAAAYSSTDRGPWQKAHPAIDVRMQKLTPTTVGGSGSANASSPSRNPIGATSTSCATRESWSWREHAPPHNSLCRKEPRWLVQRGWKHLRDLN